MSQVPLNELQAQTRAARTSKQQKRMPRTHVSGSQRARIISATIGLASDRGARRVAIADVVSTAGVSTRTFYELFEDYNDCLLAASEWGLRLAEERTRAAYEIPDRWLERVRAGLAELLQFFDEEPGMARLCVVQSAAGTPSVLARRLDVLEQLAHVIDQGRGAARYQPPPLTAEGVVCGILGVVHTKLLQPKPEKLAPFLGPLMSMVALPYLGAAAARKEMRLSNPLPAVVVKRESAPHPLDGAQLRLTHRTLAVLSAIAREPGLSNKEIGKRAGVIDQGQISRLLARLADRKLIENTGGGQPRGTTNAWRLTSPGYDVERAVREQSPVIRR
jgi:AcrR family transcriptional regulator